MVKVYRYEIHDAIQKGFTGPYTATGLYRTNKDYEKLQNSICKKHNGKHEEYPGIRDDLKDFKYELTFCACKSIKDLKTWFNGFNAPLLRVGFNLVEYTVTEISESISGKQCGFLKDKVISRKTIK